MLVPMMVKGLVIDPASNSPVVLLSEIGGDRVLPIWVGIFEANAIALRLEGVTTPRPMTHDLLKSAMDLAGFEVRKVVVSELREGTFFARIETVSNGRELELDSRPSDAIALALRTQVPIFVDSRVLDAALANQGDSRVSGHAGSSAESETEDSLRRILEQLPDEGTGKYKM